MTRLYLIDQVAFQPTLYVLDLSDPAHPDLVASYPMIGGYVANPGQQELLAAGRFLPATDLTFAFEPG
jgi:hypothetical protein